MKANLWNSLEILSTQAALQVEWQEALGDDFAPAREFLSPTQEQAGSYPCGNPIPCGCRHRVIFDSAEDVSAVCECAEEGCDRMTLRPEDLIIHAVNGGKLAEAIRRAFTLDDCELGGFGELRSRLVGSWGARRSLVFFYVPINQSGFLEEVDRLCAVSPDPFLLLTPTSSFCTPMVRRALRGHGSAQLSLTGTLALTAPGHLEIIPSEKGAVDLALGEFARRAPEGKALARAVARVEAKLEAMARGKVALSPMREELSPDVARQAFELVNKLESGAKEPTVLTVFRLYCIAELSTEQIARRCECSKGTVINRLKTLAFKTGTSPEKLRRYSAQFERLEEEMTDSRARGIYREGLTDDTGRADESEI